MKCSRSLRPDQRAPEARRTPTYLGDTRGRKETSDAPRVWVGPATLPAGPPTCVRHAVGRPENTNYTSDSTCLSLPGARVSQRSERPGPMGYWSRHAADDQSPLGCRSMASLTRRAAHGRLRRYCSNFVRARGDFGRARCPPQPPSRVEVFGENLSRSRNTPPALEMQLRQEAEKVRAPDEQLEQPFSSSFTGWRAAERVVRVGDAQRQKLGDETEARVQESSGRNSPRASNVRQGAPPGRPNFRAARSWSEVDGPLRWRHNSTATEKLPANRPLARLGVRFFYS